MPIDNPCLFVSNNLRDDMKEIISETVEGGRERGFFVLKVGDEIRRTDTEVGNKTSILLEMNKPIIRLGPKKNAVATVHTHPNVEYDWLFSPTDMQTLVNSRLQFSVMGYKQGSGMYAEVFKSPQDSFEEFSDEVLNSVYPSKMSLDNLSGEEMIAFISAANSMLSECKIRVDI